ncbi:MAG: hypothetical protein JXQ99_25965 [Hyphomicrobiaceae bacterium]
MKELLGEADRQREVSIMAHWIDATSEHKKRPVKINLDAIGYMVQDEPNGLTHIHFIGSNYATGKPDLLVLETPEALISRMERTQ